MDEDWNLRSKEELQDLGACLVTGGGGVGKSGVLVKECMAVEGMRCMAVAFTNKAVGVIKNYGAENATTLTLMFDNTYRRSKWESEIMHLDALFIDEARCPAGS